MTYKYYPITGIPAGRGPNGEVPLRQEIDDWSQKPENATQVILFLLALRRFQDIPPDRRESFFQIAGTKTFFRPLTLLEWTLKCSHPGIHGMPYKSWDEPDTTSAEVDKKGYCTHANYLFPPWHRPYLLLFEAGSRPVRPVHLSLTDSATALRDYDPRAYSRVPTKHACVLAGRSRFMAAPLLGLGHEPKDPRAGIAAESGRLDAGKGYQTGLDGQPTVPVQDAQQQKHGIRRRGRC